MAFLKIDNVLISGLSACVRVPKQVEENKFIIVWKILAIPFYLQFPSI